MQPRDAVARVGGVVVGLVAAGAATNCAIPPVEYADLVLRNGTIVTVDDLIPEAEALAVRGDRIVAVGRAAEIDRYIGDETQVIDLDGRLAIPGFIEGHGHFLGIGDAKLQLALGGAASWEQVVAMVEDAAARARPGELIRGRGWHQDKWDPPPSPSVEGLPLHDALSAVSPVNPVLLRHASGHATFANAKAMELAGITADTPDPGASSMRSTCTPTTSPDSPSSASSRRCKAGTPRPTGHGCQIGLATADRKREPMSGSGCSPPAPSSATVPMPRSRASARSPATTSPCHVGSMMGRSFIRTSG